MYANRCVAKTVEGKRCKRTKSTAEGTCSQHISMFPKQCMFTSTRFNRCTAVAPYSKDYCNGHQALREPIIIEDSDSDSDSEYIPESESEDESEYIPESESEYIPESESEYISESESEDSEWLPYDHKKQKRLVIVEGNCSESICDCHEDMDNDELNTAFYEYIEDAENPNVMLIRDTIVKTRDMSADKFNELLDYIEELIKLQ
jgi:hypothetical protein